MQEVAQPELRHCQEYLNASMWTCPDDHSVLRSMGPVDYIPGARTAFDGKYACTAGHEWSRIGTSWARAEEDDEDCICPQCGRAPEAHGDDIECAVPA